jgi:allantoate deiminase
MEQLSMNVQIDAVGNLRGIYDGNHPQAPRLIVGSHLDTVPNAGAYDGVLGVMLGVALVEALGGRRLPFAIEVVGFSEEEGVRFGFPFIGSRAFTGSLEVDLLRQKDRKGVTVEEAIREFGLDPSLVADAHMQEAAFAYLEFHIEQGPVLETLNLPLGVVEAIAGQSRATVLFGGEANHAGTTPMHFRHDALAGAAEWITAVEHEARSTTGLVATVGSIDAKPGAGNVIAGEARMTLDVRHSHDRTRLGALERILAQAHEIAVRRGLKAEHEIRLDGKAAAMDVRLVRAAEQAIRACGVEPHRMVSGAGHDAMIIREKIPSVMIFLRSPKGISHHPDETVQLEDVELALQAGLRFMEEVELSIVRENKFASSWSHS